MRGRFLEVENCSKTLPRTKNSTVENYAKDSPFNQDSISCPSLKVPLGFFPGSTSDETLEDLQSSNLYQPNGIHCNCSRHSTFDAELKQLNLQTPFETPLQQVYCWSFRLYSCACIRRSWKGGQS